MKTAVARLALSAVAFAALLASTQAAGKYETEKATRLVRSNAKLILGVAHPTAPYHSIEYRGGKHLSRGFHMSYRFNYKQSRSSSRIKGYTELKFYFDDNGRLEFIATGKYTGFVPPFAASELVVHIIKSQLKKSKKVQDSPTLMRLVETANAKGLLELTLKLKG